MATPLVTMMMTMVVVVVVEGIVGYFVFGPCYITGLCMCRSAYHNKHQQQQHHSRNRQSQQ